MLSTERKIKLLVQLGGYMLSDEETWQEIQCRAVSANGWFTLENIRLAAHNIANEFLQKDKLEQWVAGYTLPAKPFKAGIVMAGNIPLVGFHDLLCGFMSGHDVYLKLSSKDEVLLKHLIGKLEEYEPEVKTILHVSDMLKDCDAYIATGSNNTARYFEQYFGKYPHIIRKNRTSVAVLDGTETKEELSLLATDIFSYFGLGCRNVTQVYLPEGYAIPQLIDAFERYKDMTDHNKYKNNYDYHLAIYLLNRVPYYSNDSLLMVENALPFSAPSVLHYQFYTDKAKVLETLSGDTNIQCIIGHDATAFGNSQKPGLSDYADGVDTMAFLCGL